MICTACIGSFKSNYHTITTTTAPSEYMILTVFGINIAKQVVYLISRISCEIMCMLYQVAGQITFDIKPLTNLSSHLVIFQTYGSSESQLKVIGKYVAKLSMEAHMVHPLMS